MFSRRVFLSIIDRRHGTKTAGGRAGGQTHRRSRPSQPQPTGRPSTRQQRCQEHGFLQGVQCTDSTHDNGCPHPSTSHRPSRPELSLRAPVTHDGPHAAEGSQRQGEEGQGPRRRLAGERDHRRRQLEACIRDCQDQAVGNAAVRSLARGSMQIGNRPGTVDWHQNRSIETLSSVRFGFSCTAMASSLSMYFNISIRLPQLPVTAGPIGFASCDDHCVDSERATSRLWMALSTFRGTGLEGCRGAF